METFLNRNFKVKGNISCLYMPDEITESMNIANIELQLWHKAPMQAIFLGKGVTDANGEYIIEFEIDSPVDYIVDGKISDVFIRTFYNGEELVSDSLLQGLVAYWKLDEVTGTSALDASGKGHTGVLTGSNIPTRAEGKINNGLVINGATDGSGDSCLSITNSSDFNFATGDFTYSLWLKSNNTYGIGGGFALFDGGYAIPDGFYCWFSVPSTLEIYCESTLIYTRTYTLATDTWYHFIIRRIGDKLEVFINGESLGTETFSGVLSCAMSDLLFGKYSGGSVNLSGMLDEIGIWKGHGLTDDEVERIYNAGNGLQFPFKKQNKNN